MTYDYLYRLDLLVIGLILLISLILIFEIGYRLGLKRLMHRNGQPEDIGSIQGGIFGLLGIMFAFTFSMSASRFDSRKLYVVKESNAIGTTYLRVGLLPDSIRPELYNLLHKYVENRINYDKAFDKEVINKLIDSSEVIQMHIWSKAAKWARENEGINSGLFIQTLNEMIDLSAERYAVRQNHVPPIIIYLMFVLSLISVFTMGFACGLEKNRKITFSYSLVVLMIMVLLVIMDLDRPIRGVIKVEDKSMIDLDVAIEKYSPKKSGVD